MNTLEINARYKFKLGAKKLKSGKLQVKFYTHSIKNKELYGYLLVESQTSLKDVVNEICDKLLEMQQVEDYYHGHLYSIGKIPKNKNFVIFAA